MNKKLIAIAVTAGLAIPFAASAEPTFYGALQVEVASIDDGKNKDASETSPGSDYIGTDDNKRGRLGVKGSEDLGGGLKATYNFEWQVETTQGQVNDGTRVGEIGIKGAFGHITAGSVKAPYKYTGGVKYDPLVTTYLEARSRGGMAGKDADGSNIIKKLSDNGKTGSGGAGGAFGSHGFFRDAIKYSNKFGMVTLTVAMSLDEKGTSKGADGDFNAALKFGQKNWEAFVALANDDTIHATKVNIPGGPGNDKDEALGDYSATKIGGRYKIGPHVIKAQFESTEFNVTQGKIEGGSWANATGDTKTETDILFLGYELKLGKTILVAQLGNSEASTGSYTEEKDYLALGAIHKFSKKTRVFAGFSTEEWSDNAGSDAVDESVMSVGIRVGF